jgi:DNA-3-methyladenine glycosylase II
MDESTPGRTEAIERAEEETERIEEATERAETPTAVLRRDQVMADLIEEHGPVEIQPAEQSFQRLLISIINQSISTAAAETIRERVFSVVEPPVQPTDVLAADLDALADAGLGTRKAATARNAAIAFRDGEITPSALADASDAGVVDRVSEVDGLGPWTGRMYLIFGLGREDVLPLGDLAIRRGFEQLYDVEDRDAMREIAERWRPYRSYGSVYVWRAYERE